MESKIWVGCNTLNTKFHDKLEMDKIMEPMLKLLQRETENKYLYSIMRCSDKKCKKKYGKQSMKMMRRGEVWVEGWLYYF